MFAGSLQWFFGFTAFLMPLAPTLLQTQQYTIDDNQIIVDTKQHWEAWEVKAGISSITQDGSISPDFCASTWSLYDVEHGRRAIGYYPEDMSIIDPEN